MAMTSHRHQRAALPDPTQVFSHRCVETTGLPRPARAGRMVDTGDLVGAAEMADRLGLANPRLVHVCRRRHDAFPAPVAELRWVTSGYGPK